jgi:hypothetical protein
MKIIALIVGGLLFVGSIMLLFAWITASALGGALENAARKIRGKD